jgi:hypothetical protein
MSALSVEVPFPVFYDRAGEPLENGYVWIGQANLNPQTNPIQVYFDKNMTQPAAQPLRTLAGYIANAGTPAQIYVDAVNYSILVQDKNGTMVYNFQNGTGISPDACGVEYNPPFTNSVPLPVCVKLAETVSVKDFGAIGDGSSDDTIAIQNAATASGQSGTLYFPSGIYKISSNLTINTNVNFDGSQVSVDSGRTLTINGTISAALERVFSGSGSVIVSQKTPVIFPEWWGAAQDNLLVDSQPGITAAISNSSSQRNTIYFSGRYAIGSTITVLNTTQVNSSRNCTIRPLAGSGVANGIIMGAGNALGRFVMPTLVGFSGVALEVRCNLANIYVPQFNGCNVCIKFNSGHSGVTQNILDTVVELDAISACTTAVNFNHNFASDVLQGCGVKGNFITNTLNTVIFSGTTAFNDGLFLDVLAIDFVNGGGAFLDNQTSGGIPRFTATVKSWFGGDGFIAGTPTQFVKGVWNNAVIDITNARGFDQSNFTPNLLRSSRIAFRAWIARVNAIEMVPLSTGLAGFNNGKMMYQTNAVMKHTLASDLLAGGARAAYFWHVTGDSSHYPWKINVVDGGSGAIVERIHDQTSVEAGRVAVTIRNIGSSTILAGTQIFFYLERAS